MAVAISVCYDKRCYRRNFISFKYKKTNFDTLEFSLKQKTSVRGSGE